MVRFAVVLCCVAVVGCSAADGFCAAAAECDSPAADAVISGGFDAVGEDDDSAAVCVAEQDAQLRALRANDQEACDVAADKWEAYLRCAGDQRAHGTPCDGLIANVQKNACRSEIDAFREAFADTKGACAEDFE